MKRKIRWGVISTGRIADQFAQDMAFVRDAEIIACTSRTQRSAQRFADKHGVPTIYANDAALLANADIDAVYVASPHTLHLAQSKAALMAGKAVLCEKPLVVNVAECEELSAVANATGSFLMEAMWTWFLPAIKKAKQWVDAGRIGKLVQIKADFGYPQRPYSPDLRIYNAALGGGALLDMGIYPVAIATLFMNRVPNNLELFARHAPNGVEDDLSAVLDFGDCLATIGTSLRCKLPNWAYLIGEDGWIAIPDFWRAGQCHLYEMDTCIERFDDGRESIGLNFEIQSVVDDLMAGKNSSSIVPLSASLLFQQTMAIMRSRFAVARPESTQA